MLQKSYWDTKPQHISGDISPLLPKCYAKTCRDKLKRTISIKPTQRVYFCSAPALPSGRRPSLHIPSTAGRPSRVSLKRMSGPPVHCTHFMYFILPWPRYCLVYGLKEWLLMDTVPQAVRNSLQHEKMCKEWWQYWGFLWKHTLIWIKTIL